MTITYRNVKGTDLSYSEMDGNFSDLAGRTDEGWNDLVADITTRGGPSAPGITPCIGGIYAYEFNATDTQEVFATFHIHHDYKDGTMVYPHIHFLTTSSNGGVVRWGFEYTLAKRHQSTGQIVFPATSFIYCDFTIDENSEYKHFVCEPGEGDGIPGTHLEADALIMMRIFREGGHPNDTFPDGIHGLTVDVHYQAYRFCTPLRTPPFF